jgi:hypothetical protein
MKTHDSVAQLSISEAARLSGKNRATVAKAAIGLKARPGPQNAMLYPAAQLLQALYLSATGPTYSEAMRLLTIARTAQVELQNEVVRKERIPLEDVLQVMNETFAAMAGELKAFENKVMTREKINELFSAWRDYKRSLEVNAPATSGNGA